MEFKPKPKTAAPQAQTAAQPSAWQPSTPELQPIGKTGPWRRSMGLKFPDARETAQPEAGAEMEAAAKVAGNTAAPAAAKPVAAKPVFTKLTDQQVKDAQAWYAAKKEQYTPDVVKQIQQRLGIAVTGKVDVALIQAVAKWQVENKVFFAGDLSQKFEVNGKASARMLEEMFPSGLNQIQKHESFADQLKNIIAGWSKLDIDKRNDQLVTLINKFLVSIGVPKVRDVVLIDGSIKKVNGEFSSADWLIYINRPLVEKADTDDEVAEQLAGTIYHEMRHAEQFFSVIRLASSDVKIDNQIPKTDFPVDIRRQALNKPLDLGSIDGIKAGRFFYGKYQGIGAERRKIGEQLQALKYRRSFVLASLDYNTKELNDRQIKLKNNRLSVNEKTSIQYDVRKFSLEVNKLKDELRQIDSDIDRLNKSMTVYYDLSVIEDDAWNLGLMQRYKYGKTSNVGGKPEK